MNTHSPFLCFFHLFITHPFLIIFFVHLSLLHASFFLLFLLWLPSFLTSFIHSFFHSFLPSFLFFFLPCFLPFFFGFLPYFLAFFCIRFSILSSSLIPISHYLFSVYPSPHSRKDVLRSLSAPHEGDDELIFPIALRPDYMNNSLPTGKIDLHSLSSYYLLLDDFYLYLFLSLSICLFISFFLGLFI